MLTALQAPIEATILAEIERDGGSNCLGPILKAAQEHGTRAEAVEAIQKLIDSRAIAIHVRADGWPEVFLTNPPEDSISAVHAVAVLDAKIRQRRSVPSVDEATMLEILNSVDVHGIIFAVDLLPVLTSAGWTIQRAQRALQGLSERDRLGFYRDRHNRCYIALQSWHSDQVDTETGCLAFCDQ